jgi:hypothetical protein
MISAVIPPYRNFPVISSVIIHITNHNSAQFSNTISVDFRRHSAVSPLGESRVPEWKLPSAVWQLKHETGTDCFMELGFSPQSDVSKSNAHLSREIHPHWWVWPRNSWPWSLKNHPLFCLISGYHDCRRGIHLSGILMIWYSRRHHETGRNSWRSHGPSILISAWISSHSHGCFRCE